MTIRETRPVSRTPVVIRGAMAEFGEHLAEWRKLLHWPVAELATRSGVSESTIARLEHGQGASLDNVLSIARALGILQHLVEAADPWNHERGRLLASAQLPQRARKS